MPILQLAYTQVCTFAYQMSHSKLMSSTRCIHIKYRLQTLKIYCIPLVTSTFFLKFPNTTSSHISLTNSKNQTSKLAIMAPTTDLELRHYLNSKSIPCSEVEPLTGGTANYVWRIRTLLGRSSIVKHAEPYVKTNKTFEFPVVRMDFEAKALEVLFGVLGEGKDGMLPISCL